MSKRFRISNHSFENESFFGVSILYFFSSKLRSIWCWQDNWRKTIFKLNFWFAKKECFIKKNWNFRGRRIFLDRENSVIKLIFSSKPIEKFFHIRKIWTKSYSFEKLEKLTRFKLKMKILSSIIKGCFERFWSVEILYR